MADNKHFDTPMLDELENGPWPSFISGFKRLRDDHEDETIRGVANSLLGQLEHSYETRKGYWKGGTVSVFGYGGGVIPRFSEVAEKFPDSSEFHTLRIQPPAGLHYSTKLLRDMCDIWDEHGSGLIALHGQSGDIMLQGCTTDNVQPAFDDLNKIGLDMGGARIIDVDRSPDLEGYVDEYFAMRQRRGVIRDSAMERLRQHDYFAAMMVHSGHADMMIAGLSTHFTQTLQTILEVIGPAPGISRISSHYLLLLPKEVVVMADCAVNINPDAEQLAEIALLAATMSRSLGVEPRVAMLSFSNFGSSEHEFAGKVQRATEIVKERAPDLVVDGEMQLAIARDRDLRNEYFPFTDLNEDANVLIFPDMQSGNIAFKLVGYLGEREVIGPLLIGLKQPINMVSTQSTVTEIVNMAAISAYEVGRA